MAYDDLKDPDKRAAVGEKYRSVFLKTRAGRELLTHMLAELGLLEPTIGKTERELGRFDYAIRLLHIMGIPNYPNLHQLVMDMRRWPSDYPKPEVDEYGEEVDKGSDKKTGSITE